MNQQTTNQNQEERRFELIPRYDSRKSFYRKAWVVSKGNSLYLYSYDTLVAMIESGKPKVKGYYSMTTLRHIKEFLTQNGFKADTKKQILLEYGGQQ